MAEAALFLAQRCAFFLLLEGLCGERDGILDGRDVHGRLGKGVALRTLRVLLDAWGRVGSGRHGRLGNLREDGVRWGTTRSG